MRSSRLSVLPLLAALAVPLAGPGCASSTEDEPPCRIEGTYSVAATLESGDCAVSSSPVTDTISKLSDTRYGLEIQGFTGGCLLDLVESCKLQGKCDVTTTDTLRPGDVATVQYSWTFTRDGFSGFSAATIPPAKGLPNGCRATVRVTGTRR